MCTKHGCVSRRPAHLLRWHPDNTSQTPSPVLSLTQGTRKCSSSQLQCTAGEETEAAFRARHRWAARRTAHLLRGLPDKPPLQDISERIESASINIGLVVDGSPFLGSSVDVVSAAGGTFGRSCTACKVQSSQLQSCSHQTGYVRSPLSKLHSIWVVYDRSSMFGWWVSDLVSDLCFLNYYMPFTSAVVTARGLSAMAGKT